MGTPTIPNILYVPLAEENQISIWWSPPSSGTPLSYRITLNPGAVIQSIPGTWQEYTFSGLVAGTEYTATIAATNDGSTYGPVATFFPVTPDGVPLAPPQNASAIPSGSNAIFITWSPPAVLPASPIDAYVITGTSTSPNVSTITYTQPASGGTSALIQNVTPGVTYTFTIQAVNDVGFSPLASTNSVLVSATESYGIPDWAVPTFANIRAGGNNFRNIYDCITCDTQNNIYIAGRCFGSTLNLFNYYSTLGNGTISTTTAGVFVSTGLVASSAPFTYILKYTSSGSVAWFAPILPNANNGTRSSGLITDNNNNVYIQHEVNFGGGNSWRYFNAQVPGLSGRISTGTVYGTLFQSNTTSFDSVLAKYNSDGVVQWITLVGGNETQASQQRNSLVADSQNNIYSLIYSSNFTSTIFNSAAGVTAGGVIQQSTVARLVGELDTTWANQNILAKYDTDGQFQWATKSPCYFQATQQTLAIDSNDNVFMGSYLSTPSTVVFNYAGISSGVISTSIFGRMLGIQQPGSDGLVIKYNSNGQAQWVTHQSASTSQTTIATRTLATDIYGNVFSSHVGGLAMITTPLIYYSFQRVTDDLYISTVSSAVIVGNRFNIAKYNSSGQFVTCAAQHGLVVTFGSTNAPNLMTDYNGNVYYVTSDTGIGGSSAYVHRDFLSIDSNTKIVTTKDYTQVPIYSLTTTTLRKMNNNLETQYSIQLSNQPTTMSTIIATSNICIDRNNYIYIAASATVSSLLNTAIQSSIPLPQWNGAAGGPYSWPTTTTSPATVSISSIITSTSAYSVLVKYK
jgi:hypothetical protein